MRSSLIIALLLYTLKAFTQPALTPDELKSRYPKSNTVLLLHYEVFEITLKKDQPHVERMAQTQIAFINDKGIGQSKDHVIYDPTFQNLLELKANTWVYKDGKYSKRPVTQFHDRKYVEGESFYDSHMVRDFVFPDVVYGSVTEKEYTHEFLDAHFLGSFEFGYGLPSERLELIIRVDDGIEIDFKSFGDMSGVQFEKTKKGKTTEYHWTALQVPEYKDQDMVMDNGKHSPHLYPYIKNYISKNGPVEYFGNLDALYRHNYSYIKDLSKDYSIALRNVVDSIKTKNNGDEALVRGVMTWVQDNVHYIAFEDGLGGLIPRDCNLVMERKFGDCKDMANLLKNMLDYAGIPAYLCWIGTRDRNYTYEELPLPYCDNHMIAAVKLGNEYTFLDATGRYQPYGFPTMFIQGKETLISLSKDKYEIVKVPIVPAQKNTVYDEFEIRVTDKDLVLKGQTQMNGYTHSTNAERFMNAGPQNEKELMLHILKRGSNKCDLASYHHQNMNNRDSTLRIDYELTIHDYVRFVDNEMYVNLNFDKHSQELKPDEETRTEGCDYLFAYEDYIDSKFIIPTGYSVKYLPENFSLHSDYYSMDIVYKEENGAVTMNKTWKFDHIHIPFEKIDELKKHMDAIALYQRKTIVLQKK
jgi:hypothetical protein